MNGMDVTHRPPIPDIATDEQCSPRFKQRTEPRLPAISRGQARADAGNRRGDGGGILGWIPARGTNGYHSPPVERIALTTASASESSLTSCTRTTCTPFAAAIVLKAMVASRSPSTS